MKKVNKAFVGKVLGALLMMCIGFMTIRAQTTVTIGGGASGTCPFIPTATYTTPPTGVTFSNWSRGIGVTCGSATNGLSGSGFNTVSYAASFSATKYYSITISANASTPFLLSQIVWKTTISSGNANLTIEYSNNGGPVTTFGTFAQSATGTGASVTFTDLVSVVAGTSIVLYFIPSNTSAAGTTVRLLNSSTITISTGAPASTDWFRSAVSSGDWSSFSSWESSPDGVTWFPAIQIPTNAAHSVQIQNGHTIAITSAQTAKLLTIDVGGVLTHAASFGLTIKDDGTSAADFVVNGRYELYGTSPSFALGTEKLLVNSGGEVRVIANIGSSSDNIARDIHGYWNTGAIFNWASDTINTFKTNIGAASYFPNAGATDIAIFRVSANIKGTVGANTDTKFNGKFEIASGYTDTFKNAGKKIFRDGLGGGGTLVHSNSCGPFQITSASAVIDGSLTVDFMHATGNALEIPSGANVTMGGTATVNLGKTPYIQASLLVDGVLTTNGNFNIKSDANGTARVAQITTGTINGNVTIERFIPAKRAWRLLTSSLSSSATQTINAAWQEGAIPNPSVNTLNDPKPGYGTQITKNLAADIANGYDANLQTNPSIYSMDNATTAVIASTFTPIANNRSYFLFVRGNRANQINLGTAAPTSTTTLRTTGTINQGVVNVATISPSGSYVGVGNPYPSAIDITSVLSGSTNIDGTTFARWDPGVFPYGAYIQYAGSVSAPLTTNYPTTASTFIMQSGEAFLLKASGINPMVKFQENTKTTANSSTVFARPVPPVVHIDLYNSSTTHVDGVAIGFAERATAPKLGKTGEEMMLSQHGKSLAIQLQPLDGIDTFYLEFAKLTQQTYHLRITQELQELDAHLQLVDLLTNKHMELNGITNGYSFTVTVDTQTYKHRFIITAKGKPKKVYTTLRDELFVYPNPTPGMITINSEIQGPVQITDITGRVLRVVLPIKNTIDCSSLQKGLYFLKGGNRTISFTKL